MFFVNENIAEARTIDSSFYKSSDVFKESKTKIFRKSWQFIETAESADHIMTPFNFLGDFVKEPLIYVKSESDERIISNVCTHRGKILVEKPSDEKNITCGYHGRCFRSTGKYHSMPRFEGAKNFPDSKDNLKVLPLKKFAGLTFSSLEPDSAFNDLIKPMTDRLDFLDLSSLKINPNLCKEYTVNAHWALYCDNYLEGFHVPFVHPSLEQSLDLSEYSYELFGNCNLQVGIAKENEVCFDLPKDHMDYGKRIFGYYFWLYPNMMFNFYPWGLSFNHVVPVSQNLTKVYFRTYLFEGTKHKFEDTNLDITEMEDEAVVESVQRGIESEIYESGRYSPTMEKCLHHFHSLASKDFRV